jgi:ankyrin repeat protein
MSTLYSSSNDAEFPEYLLPNNQISSEINLELYNAAADGDKRRVKKALDNGAKPNFFNAAQEQKTAFHIATENGFPDIVQMLLDSGAVIDVLVAGSKDTALLIAAEKNESAIVKILIAAIPPPDLNHQVRIMLHTCIHIVYE